MNTYETELNEHRRIAILRILKTAPDYSANCSVITDVLQQVGLKTARHITVAQLEWLAEIGLITLEDYEQLKVAVLTDRGFDVAAGTITVAGVKRPRPGKG